MTAGSRVWVSTGVSTIRVVGSLAAPCGPAATVGAAVGGTDVAAAAVGAWVGGTEVAGNGADVGAAVGGTDVAGTGVAAGAQLLTKLSNITNVETVEKRRVFIILLLGLCENLPEDTGQQISLFVHLLLSSRRTPD